LDIPLILSANFGELRPNHFHSGVDFKTQGVINKPVYSIEDGYVSRVSVSPSGYGLAIYVAHTTGQTSVYGHIEKFTPKIAAYVKEKQYEQKSFRVDLRLDSTVFPVKRGDLIAYSGNTGSSGGPHVHFEIRDTELDLALDPLVYYKDRITDGVPPQLRGIAIYPIPGRGAVNNISEAYHKSIVKDKKGEYEAWSDTVIVWGRVGMGVYTNDRMTDTHNIYGVRKVKLFCDDEEVFSSEITSVNFDQTRIMNSMVDFDYWYHKRVFYQKSFIEPGNKLPVYKARNNGFIDVNQERLYHFRYELEDLYSNKAVYSFVVQGKPQEIVSIDGCTQYMRWDEDNYYTGELFSINIPAGNLYDNVCFSLSRSLPGKYLSSVYQVNDRYVPLNDNGEINIKMTKDSLENKSQYGIVRVQDDKEYWVGGTYHNGTMSTKIRELGHTYAVSSDRTAPTITPIQPNKWTVQKQIKIKLSDNKSGVSSFRGEIDGEFVLFEHDVKSSIYTYRFDNKRLKSGQTHKLIFTATDACGNNSSYEYQFKY
jgi:murein DD-endopeptidase MepM/ murein hydrolase activator NlpD